MNEQQTNAAVTISAEEYARLKALEAAQKEQAEKKAERATYRTIVDNALDEVFPDLCTLSACMGKVKNGVIEEFRTIIQAKVDMFGLKSDSQRSHTFTHSDGTKRLTLGVRTTDGYHDTAGDGEEMIKQELQTLASDEKSKSLINTILRLLARDGKGNLKPSKVVQLRKMAEELGNKRILEGVQIIQEAYIPSVSRMYIKVEEKTDLGAWKVLPLSVTEAQENTDPNDFILAKKEGGSDEGNI